MSRYGSLGAIPCGAVRRRRRAFLLGSDPTETGVCGIFGAADGAPGAVAAAGAEPAGRPAPFAERACGFTAAGGASFEPCALPPFAADFGSALAGCRFVFAEMPFAFATGCVLRGDAFVLVNVVFRALRVLPVGALFRRLAGADFIGDAPPGSLLHPVHQVGAKGVQE